MDLATGTAGVLLALGAALHSEPVDFPLLGAATPPVAPPLQRPPRQSARTDHQTPAGGGDQP
jgi:hypothetical protein